MNKKVFIIATAQEVGFESKILNYPIIFSGIGKINATIAAYAAVSYGYSEIINIGSCGSEKLNVGDVVKVGQCFQDIDATPIDKYGLTPFEPNSNQIIIDVNSKYKCFTTDYFFDKNQIEKYSKSYLSMIQYCDIFDMECFAIAKVCKKFNIKFSSYKWVSDNGDASQWIQNCEMGFNKIKLILNETFEKGRI